MRKVAIALGGFWLARAACAQPPAEEPPPDLDFLEYLGSWQDDDDAWLAIEEWNKDDGRSREARGSDAQRDAGRAPRVDGEPDPRAAAPPPSEDSRNDR
jgi:hypothetical protein